LVEQAAHNRCVVGSNPALATKFVDFLKQRVKGNLYLSQHLEGVHHGKQERGRSSKDHHGMR
jgi:hypothetical protein